MNTQLQVRSMSGLSSVLRDTQQKYHRADTMVQEALHNLNDVRVAALADPCDYNKASEQRLMEVVREMKRERESLKVELRKNKEAVRTFIYHAKPSLTANGRALRH